MSAQRGTVLKARLGQKAAEAYTNLANQFKVAGAKQVVADDATKMIKQRYGPSAPYIIKTLIERQVLVMKDGVTYLVEAEITVDHRGSHRHTNGDRPAGAVASAGSRRGPGANGHSGTSILGALTEHAALVRSIGLLKRTERIGPTVTELERMLDRLDPNLCVVDENDGFALKLKAATPQRRARSPKPKRR